jgi:uracil-DNA glycosylase
MLGEDDPRRELRTLAAALAVHAERLAASGALGVPPAPEELRRDAARGAVRAEPAFAPDAPASEPDSGAMPLRVPPSESSGETLSPEERRRRLDVLAEEVRGCTRCGLHASRTQTVFARGDGSAGLCFVGEGPGADEDAQGYPFVGAAGQLLDRMIAAMGFSRDEVYVCNIVKCRPPKNRKPEPDEMAACMPYLEQQLDLIQPSVIVALGATAVQGLFGGTVGITRLRGRFKLYRGRIAVMPTFHPAYLLRTPKAKREVWKDLQAVLRQMGRPIPSHKDERPDG